MSLFFAPSRELAAKRLETGGSRIYDTRERVALAGFDAALRAGSILFGLRPRATNAPVERVERIVCLRLDRLGDLLTTLPAIEAVRRAAPNAHLELAVGSWNEPVAKRLPFVDSVRIVDTPWASWSKKVSLGQARRALGVESPDLALEFQGDVRVLLLMALTRPTFRAGYGDTGGAYLLSHRAVWDESKSWYWQNSELVRTVFPHVETSETPFNFVTEPDRVRAAALVGPRSGPVVGIHPSAGRALKQWEEEKFAALIDRLSARATVVVTGAEGDRDLVDEIVSRSTSKPAVLLGVDLAIFAAVVESFDVFVSGDTGPMHLSHAVGTPNVAIFGPSDPVRYGPTEGSAVRRIVRTPVYCSPCNMIRRPPKECGDAPAPECIVGIALEQVESAVVELLGG